jgi:cytochrome c
VNPSLTEISTAYQGKEEQLIKYLKGESEAIVRPEKANLMKRHIEKTKRLSGADLKSLAGYILSEH